MGARLQRLVLGATLAACAVLTPAVDLPGPRRAVWVASGGGLSRLTAPPTGPALSVFGDPAGSHGLTDSSFVESVAVNTDGHVWAGLSTRGIDILDPGRGRLTNLPPDASRPGQAFPPTQMKALAEAPNGDMFLGTQHGLYRADATGGAIVPVAVPGRDGAAVVAVLKKRTKKLLSIRSATARTKVFWFFFFQKRTLVTRPV